MEIVANFFLRKKAGFYIGLVTAVLSLVCAIVYISSFNPNGEMAEYASIGVFILMLFAFFSFVGLSVFKETSGLAPVAMGILSFIAFLLFIIKGYMYFSEVFYGEVTFQNFIDMNSSYLFSMIAMLLIVILSNVSLYLKQEKTEVANENGKNVSGVHL